MRNRKSLILAILSIACPFATVAAVVAYQSFAHSHFWNSLGPEDSPAGALMGFIEITQLLYFAVLGCLAGFALSLISLLLKPQNVGVRMISILGIGINCIPLLFFVLTRVIDPAAW